MLTLNFDPFPVLETERLHLRALNPKDIEQLFALRSDKEAMRYIAKPVMKTLSDAEAHIKMVMDGLQKLEHINWAITLKGEDSLMGMIGFYRMLKEHYRTEVGYMLLPNFHRQGIMHEALKVVLAYGFKEMKAHSIAAVIDPRNAASENILLKNHFIKEAHFKENYFFDGEYLDSAHYSLLAKNYR